MGGFLNERIEATDPTRTPTRGSKTVDPAAHHLRSPTAHATAQSAIAAARRRSGRRNARYRRRSYGDRSGEPNATAHDEPPRPTSTSTAPTTAHGRRRRNDTTGGRSTSDHPGKTAAPERKRQLAASASARLPPSPPPRAGTFLVSFHLGWNGECALLFDTRGFISFGGGGGVFVVFWGVFFVPFGFLCVCVFFGVFVVFWGVFLCLSPPFFSSSFPRVSAKK